MNEYAGIGILFLFSVVVGGTILLLNWLLGPKQKQSAKKSAPYECGVEPFELPRGRFSIKFYVSAMLFVAFDVEVLFLYLWAVLFRELGWLGFVEMSAFLVVLAGGLAYAWRKGALKWT